MRNSVWLLALAVGTACAPAWSKQVVCWTDKFGAHACGDRVPPEYAKDEREVLNSRGMVVGTKPREKTEAELAAEQKAAEAAAAEQKRRVRQVAYDRFMLQSYESVTQLQKVRDDNLRTVESRLSLAEKAVPGAEAGLKAARARAAAEADKDAKDKIVQAGADECTDPQIIKDWLASRPQPKPVKGKPPPPKESKELNEATAKWNSRQCGDVRRAKQLSFFEQGLVDSLKSVQSLKQLRDDTNLRFDRDISRYKKLRAQELAVGAPDPDMPDAPPGSPH